MKFMKSIEFTGVFIQLGTASIPVEKSVRKIGENPTKFTKFPSFKGQKCHWLTSQVEFGCELVGKLAANERRCVKMSVELNSIGVQVEKSVQKLEKFPPVRPDWRKFPFFYRTETSLIDFSSSIRLRIGGEIGGK